MQQVASDSDKLPDDLSPVAAAQLLAYDEAKALESDFSPDKLPGTARQKELESQFACVDLLHRVWSSLDPVPSVPKRSLLPKVLGDFRLIREIGCGGMGVVYEAEQVSMGRRVALKVLPLTPFVDDKSLQRFRNEVRAAAALDHPHIVSVYSVGEDSGHYFYTMQLIRGQTVADLIEDLRNARQADLRRKKVSAAPTSKQEQAKGPSCHDSLIPNSNDKMCFETKRELHAATTTTGSQQQTDLYRMAAHLGIQACEALQHAHDLAVLHRDIKPSNLLLDSEGKLYVADFGLARIGTDVGLTMTGEFVGTLRYMAPEKALAKSVVIDHRADIYSLGATLYELLTFEPVFSESDRTDLLKQIALEDPPAPRKLDQRVPVDLETIVLKTISKEPGERYQTAGGLADDLRAFLEHRPITARPPSFSDRAHKWARRHSAIVQVAALALFLLTALFAISTVIVKRAETRAAIALEKTSELLYSADMSVAYQTFAKGWPVEAQSILNRFRPTGSEPDRRRLEWHLLQKVVQQPPSSVLSGHRGPVNELAVFPDHQRLASVGDDGTLRIWKIKGQRLVQTLHLCDDGLHSVAISPDGRYIAAGSTIVYLCDLNNPEHAKEVFHNPNDYTIESLAFSPKGEHIAVGVRYDEVCFLSMDGHVRKRIRCASRVLSLEFMSDGSLLVPNRQEMPKSRPVGIVQLWDDGLTTVQREFDGSQQNERGEITIARTSPDNKFIAAGEFYQSRTCVFESKSGRVLARTPRSRDLLTDLAFSPNGQALAIAYVNGQVEYFELQPGADGNPAIARAPLVLNAHKGLVQSVRFVDARTLVTCGADGLIRIWRLPASLDAGYDVTDSILNGIRISPDATKLLCTSPDEYLILNPKNGEVSFRHHHPGSDYCSPVWAPAGDKAAVCCKNTGMVSLLAPSGQQLRSIECQAEVEAASFSSDGRTIAIIGEKQFQLCRTDTGKTVFRQDLTDRGTTTAFSHSGARLAYGGQLGKIVILDSAKLAPERELLCPIETKCMAFSPDDRLLATGHNDSMIRIWEVQTGQLRAELVGNERCLHDVAFSPDGRTLLSAAGDGAIHIWSVDHGRAYGVFYQRSETGARDVLCHLDLAPENRYLAVGYGTDNPKNADVFLWRLGATDETPSDGSSNVQQAK